VNGGRLGPLLLAAIVVALLFAAPSAFAAVRYATPGGSNLEPCNPTACNLPKAVNGAGDGDEVVVGPGTYKPTAEVEVDRAISVGGSPGATPPVVQISNHFLRLENAAALVHDLRIEVVAPTMPYAINDEAGTVERVYAYSTESAGACEIASGTIRDSVCWGGLVASAYTGGNVRIVLRNVTATTTVMGASTGTNAEIDGANLIMHSIDPGQSSGADLAIDVNSGASATISLSHSDYSTVYTGLSAGTDFTYPPPGTNGNQTAPPLFVDAAAGDVHELAGSPTIDAGELDPLIGAIDLEGAARSQPSCLGGTPAPDIGAYELAPTVACPEPAPQPSTPQPATPRSVVARPSNLFRLGRLRYNEKKGTASLAVRVPGPGTLTLGGRGLVKKRTRPHGAETVKLAIKLKHAGAKRLRARGKLKVRAAVTYTPTAGDPRTVVKPGVKLVYRG
jgi:hypothetical protein